MTGYMACDIRHVPGWLAANMVSRDLVLSPLSPHYMSAALSQTEVYFTLPASR